MHSLVLLAVAKLILTSWDIGSLRYDEVLRHVDQFDVLPFEGAVLPSWDVKLANGKTGAYNSILTDAEWDRAALEAKAPILRELTRHRSFKELFMGCRLCGYGRLDWRDDAGWKNAAHNYAALAHLAKLGGARGVWFDPEDYAKKCQYYRIPGDPEYGELFRLARQRGREVFTAIFNEFPDATLLSAWFLSFDPDYFGAGAIGDRLKAQGDVWPAFINGMLDVLPPTARVIDGDEHGYRYEDLARDFEDAVYRQRVGALRLVAPENRAKYRAQVDSSFGLFLDMYVNDEKDSWYFGPLGGSRLAHFAANLNRALTTSDSYVWVYSQKYSWAKYVDTINKNNHFDRKRFWTTEMPGLDKVLLAARSPSAFLTQFPEAGAASPNRATGKPASWQSAYRHEINNRTGTFLPEVPAMVGVPHGCLMYPVRDVKPGELYRVSVKVKGEHASSQVKWQKDGKWTSLPGRILDRGEADPDGWRTFETVVIVPAGADILNFSVWAWLAENERVELKDASVRLIDPANVR